jgi:hypothetical protein
MAIPILAVLGGLGAGFGLASMFPPIQRGIAYPLNRLIPNEVISSAEALELALREDISSEQLDYELKSMGLNSERQAWLMQLKRRLLGIGEVVTLWRREEIDEGTRNERLKHLGIVESDIELVIKVTEHRPAVDDIIRFAVREVYTPEIAEKFGQFEGADEVATVAAEDLKALGIRPEDLRKYWGSHWVLPSVQMGFEMLHRNVIDNDTLQLLMRASDIMPYWRDKLTEISYNPLTRVDVRRMHKLGVISEADVTQAYKDLGYNEENAKLMTDFTIQYNADPETSEQTEDDKEKAKQRDLTKSDIVNGFGDGMFNQDEATQVLTILGYSQEEIEFLLSRELYEREKSTISKYISAYRTAYLNGAMTYNEIVDGLNKLNLSSDRIDNLVNLWDIERSIKTQKPTKAEVLTFLRKKVIDRSTAEQELLSMGYSTKYVGWYLATT